jgi:hypothetical protein
MPEAVLSSILSRIETNFDLFDYQMTRKQCFEKNLETHCFSEIIRLPDIKTAALPNSIQVSFSIVLNSSTPTYYILEEYIHHLEHLVYLLNTYPNFYVILIDVIPDENYMVYVKEDRGAIVASTSNYPVVLDIKESNMTAAFWDFLFHIIEHRPASSSGKKETIQKLTDYIHDLKQYVSDFKVI